MDRLLLQLENTFDSDEISKLEQFYRLLVEWNEKMNLTGITNHQEVFVKHFLDSLAVKHISSWQTLTQNPVGRVIDVGTGAGFPGIPLAICFPQTQFVLCDSLRKRIGFLDTVVEALDLRNVETVHGRAEILGREARYRGRFQGVLSRAVARLNVLLEFQSPFAAVGGYLFCYKGPNVVDELVDGKRAASVLGVGPLHVAHFELPHDAGMRSVVWSRQETCTNVAYPRTAGTPSRKPL